MNHLTRASKNRDGISDRILGQEWSRTAAVFMIAVLIICCSVRVSADLTRYFYDDAGRLTKVDYGNGMNTIYEYDPAGNLLNRVTDAFTPTEVPTAMPEPSPTPWPTVTPTGGIDRHVPGGYPNVQAAVDACNDGDRILLAPGTYTGVGNKFIDFLGKAITITADEGKGTAVIDCEGEGRAVHFHSGEGLDSILMGISIRNGYMPLENGACILIENSSPSIIDCDIENTMELWHQCYNGAGIMCLTASPLIQDCSFLKGNAAIGGGGIACDDQAHPQILNCVFRENFGYNLFTDGGGAIICSSDSDPVIDGCVFNNNEGGNGGAVFAMEGSAPVITNSRFVNNMSHRGGGAFACEYGSEPVINGCSFTGNSSASDGGAVYIYEQSNALIRNCTFNSNIADSDGGAVMNWVDSSAVIESCCFVDNEATYIGGCGAICNRAQMTITHCTFIGNRGTCDPEFGPSGGALCLFNDTVVNNCLIAENYTFLHGGAVYASSGDSEINNSTLAANKAGDTGLGAGIYCDDGAVLTIQNSILWNDSSTGDEIYVADGLVTVSFTDIQGGWTGPGSDNINSYPEFSAGPFGSYHLDFGSPCIDTGNDRAANICYPTSEGQFCMSHGSVFPDLWPDEGIVDLGRHFPRFMPTPTFIPTIAPSPTEPVFTFTHVPPTNTPTPLTPTMCPTASPTTHPTAIPTQPCSQTGVTLFMPSDYFQAGDPVYLAVMICNAEEAMLTDNPLFLLLDVYGEYWFAPSWIYVEDGADYYMRNFAPGANWIMAIQEFPWPQGAGSASDIFFHAALTDPGVTTLLGEFDSWRFGWGD